MADRGARTATASAGLPVSALLSQLLVALTIEVDNEFEHHMRHRTSNHGASGRGPWLTSFAMWGNFLRFVQLTPPGSACSIVLGEGIVDGEPGSVSGLQMVVSDVEQAHAELSGRGVEVSDVEQMPWGSFIFFSDPDGNRWAIQQVPPRG